MNSIHKVRMVRPAWDVVTKNTQGSYVLCSCGDILQVQQALRVHWQLGHFDQVHPNDLKEETKNECRSNS